MKIMKKLLFGVMVLALTACCGNNCNCHNCNCCNNKKNTIEDRKITITLPDPITNKDGEKVIATINSKGDTTFTRKDGTEEIWRANGERDFSDGRTSSFKHGEYKYLYVNTSCMPDTVYDTYEQYMWDEAFPQTIIVRFTRNGKFVMYVDAERGGGDVTKDKDGNYISPEYVFMDEVGHQWVYDLKGKFVRFEESPFPHNNEGERPYKP